MSPAEYNGLNQHRQHLPEPWPAELLRNAPRCPEEADAFMRAKFTTKMNWMIEQGLAIEDGRNCDPEMD